MVYDGHFQQFRWNYDGHMIPKKYRNDKRRWPTMGIYFLHLRWFPFHDGFNKGEKNFEKIYIFHKITPYNTRNHDLKF